MQKDELSYIDGQVQNDADLYSRGKLLQRQYDELAEDGSSSPEQITDDWESGGTVRVIDDEEMVRETAVMMLEDMGFETLTAVDGLDSVEVYRQHQDQIVAVLLDMTMPKLDGKGCFRELKRTNQNVKVVLSSGYNKQEATNRFTSRGLAGFIQKPYKPDELQEAIRLASTEKA